MSDISNEDWNENEEEYLKKLHYQCIEFFKHWNQKFLYYEKKNKYFNIPILIISASNSLFAITLTNWIDQKYVSIINAVLSVMTAIIGSIQLFLKINEKMGSAYIVSIKFHKLSLKISKEMSILREKRICDGKTFLNEIFNEFNDIIEKAGIQDTLLKDYLQLDKKTVTPPSSLTSGSRDGLDV
jgi:hypothetical protein